MPKVYKEDQCRFVYDVDLRAWLEDGWSREPQQVYVEELGLVDLNVADLEKLNKMGLTLNNAKKVIEARPLESVEAALAQFTFLEKHKERITVK